MFKTLLLLENMFWLSQVLQYKLGTNSFYFDESLNTLVHLLENLLTTIISTTRIMKHWTMLFCNIAISKLNHTWFKSAQVKEIEVVSLHIYNSQFISSIYFFFRKKCMDYNAYVELSIKQLRFFWVSFFF